MENVRTKKGRRDHVLTKTINTAKRTYCKEMNLLAGISPDLSVAQKTIEFLKAQNISYYALIMEKMILVHIIGQALSNCHIYGIIVKIFFSSVQIVDDFYQCAINQ